jgi:hypothetical protein
LTRISPALTVRFPDRPPDDSICSAAIITHKHKETRMRFVKVKDEERTGEVAINLDLVREAHLGGGLLHIYFERSSSAQDDMTFTGENAQKIWAAMG